MKVLNERPPRFAEILKVFPMAGDPGVIFAWGEVIYNPSGGKLRQEIISHEEVHGKRQGNAVESWWDRYLIDPQFRLEEELPAHKAEYMRFCARHSNRAKREHYLMHVAEKLSSPLYGNVITMQKAVDLLR
jgi:hypothetical protein